MHDVAVAIVVVDKFYSGPRRCPFVVERETTAFENSLHFFESEVSWQGPKPLYKLVLFVHCN